jgi:hypothetical protein
MADLSCVPKWVKKEIIDVWVGESLKLMLLKDNHVPNASTQRYVADVSANEIIDTAGVYVAGGVTVTGAVALADGNNYALDIADITIGPGANLNYRYGILYKNVPGNPAISPIRAHIDFLTNQIVLNGSSTIQWNVLGVIYVS